MEMTKSRGSLLSVLKHGIEISNVPLKLMYTKPATNYNRELVTKYEKNIFSVAEEVWASDKERIDLVIFFRDPISKAHYEPDIGGFLNVCDQNHIPFATNIATAELLIKSLERGDLQWRDNITQSEMPPIF